MISLSSGCLVGCQVAEVIEELEPVVVQEAAPPPLRVSLSGQPDAGLPRGAEVAGLLLVLLELGLADLEGVVPQVEGVALAPGLVEPLEIQPERWRGRLAVGGSRAALRAALELCPPAGDCAVLEAALGSVEDPTPAAAALLRAASDTLARMPLEGSSPEWDEVQSDDPYAVLLAGRAGAVFYGLLPPVAEALVGDRRNDPITRATYLDPYQPAASWLLARRALARGELDRALARFRRAALGRPGSAAVLADLSATLTADGQHKAAWRAWQLVQGRSQGDLRYALPMTRAALAAGQPEAALAVLETLPEAERLAREPSALRVAVADALDRPPGYDDLLAAWAIAAPDDPEPLRRRIRLRVREARYQEALALSAGLAERGVAEEGVSTAVALEAALGRWSAAASRAEAAGRPGQAARLRARGALESGAAASLEGDGDPVALVLDGEAALGRGDAVRALARANQALGEDPWYPSALALQAAALDALGDAAEAARSRAALVLVDPLAAAAQGGGSASAGPSTAPGRTE